MRTLHPSDSTWISAKYTIRLILLLESFSVVGKSLLGRTVASFPNKKLSSGGASRFTAILILLANTAFGYSCMAKFQRGKKSHLAMWDKAHTKTLCGRVVDSVEFCTRVTLKMAVQWESADLGFGVGTHDCKVCNRALRKDI